jgi:hypothetical protein
MKPGHAPTSKDRMPGTISLDTRLFFVIRFKLFFVRSYPLSKHHSLCLTELPQLKEKIEKIWA